MLSWNRLLPFALIQANPLCCPAQPYPIQREGALARASGGLRDRTACRFAVFSTSGPWLSRLAWGLPAVYSDQFTSLPDHSPRRT